MVVREYASDSIRIAQMVSPSGTIMDPLQKALRLFLGWDEDRPLPFAAELVKNGSAHPSVVIFESPSADIRKRLARQGYTHQLRFMLLPSRKNPRWLLPYTSERRAIDGFQLYMPYSQVARLVKALIVQTRAAGWQGWARNTVLIASQEPLPIEHLASEVTGEKDLLFSLSRGTAGPLQKLTVQVMTQDSSVLGYMKMPMTYAAGERLRHEADFIQSLGSYPNLRPNIPRLLFADLWNGRYTVFQSPVEGEAGPVQFTALHEEFLNRLHGCRAQARPGVSLVENVGRKWESVAPRLGAKWQSLGRDALGIAARELDGSHVPCGIQHGDFAPWNTRIKRGGLSLFDWESATWDAPILWDQFHFLAQTECLLNVSHRHLAQGDVRRGNRGLYMLYLLNSVVQFSGESAGGVVIKYREKQLLQHMSHCTVGVGA